MNGSSVASVAERLYEPGRVRRHLSWVGPSAYGIALTVMVVSDGVTLSRGHILVWIILGLLAFGLVMIRSAAPRDVADYNFLGQQLFFVGVGLAAMVAATFFDYRFLGAWSRAIYVGIVGLLGIVFVLGQTSFGAQRWLTLLNTQLQPSEFAKLAIIIVTARFLADRPYVRTDQAQRTLATVRRMGR